MRSPFPRGNFLQSIACLSLWLGGIQSLAIADDSAAVVEDHPIVVVTAASIDRLLERGALLSELAGGSLTKESLAAATVQDGQSLLKGVDRTKPAGVMLFFSLDAVMRSGDSPIKKAKTSNKDAGEEPLGDKRNPPRVEGQAEAADESESDDNASSFGFDQALNGFDAERMVTFVPFTNFDEVLEALKLTPVSEASGTYTTPAFDFFGHGNSIAIRRIGSYMLIGKDVDLLAHCPDPRSLVRPLLGNHDLVVSFQAKGLPAGLRTLGAQAVKFGYAATVQQRDGEPKAEYELRRAAGDLVAELLDLALSHIDAVNCGLRIDPKQKQLVVEFDVAGAENGKLAKFAKEWTPKRSHFSGLWQEEGPISLGLSLAIPDRHSKAITTAMRSYVQQANVIEKHWLDEFAPLVKVTTKLIESGQLELLLTTVGTNDDGSAILGIKLPSGPKFPEQFQQMLEQSKFLKEWGAVFATEVDAVNGYPVHTAPYTILNKLFSITIGESDKQQGSYALTATPDAIWLAWSNGPNRQTVPDLLRLAVEQPSSKPVKSAGSNASNIAPLRITFHSSIASSGTSGTVDPNETNPKVRQAQLEQAAREKQEQEVVSAIFQEKGDAVRFELRPSATGLQLTIRLEEAYLALYGHYFAEVVSGSTVDTND